MMTYRMQVLSVLGLALVFCVARAGVAAEDAEEKLKKRFQERHDQLVKMKQAGKVGERFDGYAEAVTEEHAKDEAVTKLVDVENTDRKEYFAILAKKQKTTVESVAQQFALFKFQKAGEEEYFKTKAGEWKKKKDLLAKKGE